MEYDAYISHVRLDGERLVSAARVDLTSPIPSCPGWTMRDLLTHVAEVYEHKMACTALGRAPEPWPPEWAADRDPAEWLADAHARLLAMFDGHGPRDPSATWWPPDQTVGFWARRMAHETAIHRVDAELAVGEVTPVDAELALDGIDEVLTIMLAGDWSEAPSQESAGQRVAVVAADRRWIVTLDREAISVTEDDTDTDAAIEGDPSDVELWLWGRTGDRQVTWSGSEAAIRLLRSRLALATQ
jgi:uncharacterized protein (TIGR03083 family)